MNKMDGDSRLDFKPGEDGCSPEMEDPGIELHDIIIVHNDP